MTPAERDEVRRRASDRLADHSMATVTSNDRCACDRCVADRAVLRYVPPGVCIEIDATALPVEFKTIGIRNAAHALHAAADAAEESWP